MSNESMRSTISSRKDGCRGDFECSSSSSVSSSYSSPHRSYFGEDVVDRERRNLDKHFDKLKKYKKQVQKNDILELSHTVKAKRVDSFLSQYRRFNSAPVFTTKPLSSKLQIIEENDEQGSSSVSNASVCKNLKDSDTDGRKEGSRVEATESRTPRFYEVPPKKQCIRINTPQMRPPGGCVPIDLKGHVSECWTGGNKRITIGNKDYIVRKDNTNVTSVSTQIEKIFQEECDSSNKQKKLEAGDSSSISHIEGVLSQVNLPQSVAEDSSKNSSALEPNIIIIDTTEEKRNNPKWKRNAIGDASSCSGDGSVKDYKSSETGSLTNIFKRCIGTPRYSIKPTPTYMVSTNYSDSTLRSSARKSEIESVPASPIKYHSNTKVIERKVTAINAATSELATLDDFYEIADVKSYKSVLLDFSSGITPTRSFPIHFDDLETLEATDHLKVTSTFKEKGSELLQSASSRLNYLSKQYRESSNASILTMSPNKVENVKNASLIDVRTCQHTNIDYYLVGSSSESCVPVSEEGSIILPQVNPSEIEVSSDKEDQCCSCFRSLRLL